jgi:pyruvate formate lyase activating enzyme
MKIVGYQGVSLIDFPGHIASVLYTTGCNFACPYCQNPDLVKKNSSAHPMAPNQIEEIIFERKGFIDGVSITGGEPTLWADLPDFLQKLRDMDLKTKVDTNGYLPDVIANLLEKGLVDFVAMDIKSSFDKYAQAAGTNVDIGRVDRSIELLMNSNVDYEFRTTVHPDSVTKDDIKQIAARISGAKSYRLQQFSNRITLDPALVNVKPYLPAILQEMAEIARQYVPDTKIRGI